MTWLFLNKCVHIKFLYFVHVPNYCVLVELLVKSDRPVCKDSQINVQSTLIYEVKRTENMIKTKCVIVETDDVVYITPLSNPYERD